MKHGRIDHPGDVPTARSSRAHARASTTSARSLPPIARSWPATIHPSRMKPEVADLSRLADELLAAAMATRRSEALLVREQAVSLSWLSVGNRPETCGFSSLSRLALEVLGLRPRTVRDRLSLHRLFARFPAVERAFLEGRITACQALAVAPLLQDVDGKDTISIARWIETAGRAPVRTLRHEMRTRQRSRTKLGGCDVGDNDPLVPDRTEPSVPGTGGAEVLDISTSEAIDLQGRMVSISGPVGFQVVFDQTVDLARKVIGFDAPIHECIAAILAEANWTGVGSTPKQSRFVTPPRTIALRPRTEVPIRLEAIRHARLTLLRVRGYVRDLLDLAKSGEPTSPRDALHRLRQVRLLRTPQRVLLAHLIRDLRRTYAMDLLGYRSMADLVEDRLGLSERSARNRVAESLLFESEQEIEQAVGRGEISLMQAHLIRRMQPVIDVEPFIERAREVSWRQFQRECRLLDLLRKCGLGQLSGRPLSQSGIEEALIEAIGGDRNATEEELRRQGIAPLPVDGADGPSASDDDFSDPGACGAGAWVPRANHAATGDLNADSPVDRDPASNPIVMERLEALVEMLASTMWDDAPQATAPDRQLSATLDPLSGGPAPLALDARDRQTSAAVDPASAEIIDSQLTGPSAQSIGILDRQLSAALDPHIRVRFWAPNPTADDFRAVIDRFRLRHSPRIPTWAAVVILFAQVTKEWEREDPERRPVRAKILKRDHYRCIIPGCGRRSQLEDHHIEFRSRGGGNEDSNRATLCHGHHAHGVHKGRVRIMGRAPHALRFELGCLEDGPPLFVYQGEKKVASLWE